MRALAYAFREAWSNLWRRGRATGFAIAAITLATLVLGALLLVTWNIDQWLARWSASSELSVFLRDEASSEQRGAIESAIDQSGIAEGREYISKEQAVRRFRSQFADLASLADGVDANPFPASIEVRIRAEAERDGRVAGVVSRLAAMQGAADVRYDREWLARARAGLASVRSAGLAVAFLMALAAAATVAAVVQLGLESRGGELEIMRLVGSPLAFIRGPFIAEGLLQGGIGALLALILLGVGFAVARVWWGADIAGMFDGAEARFLPMSLVLALVAGGMVVGATGGVVASRRAV